jgi:uncharacterized membrane protein
MKTTLQKRLLAIIILSVLLVVIITLVPNDTLRIALGLPFVMFFPGYTLIAALFPEQDTVDSIERLALSLGSSVAVVVLTLFILNYSPWGINLYPILFSLALFVVVTALVAWQRQRRAPGVTEPTTPSDSSITLEKRRGGHKAVWVVLNIAVVGAIGICGYLITSPKAGDSFTELYALNLEGKASGYPSELAAGEEGKVTIGIVNHEHQPVTYSLEVVIDDTTTSELAPITLEHEGEWEETVTFAPDKPGDNQKVEFLLRRLDQDGVYRSLNLWINVREEG